APRQSQPLCSGVSASELRAMRPMSSWRRRGCWKRCSRAWCNTSWRWHMPGLARAVSNGDELVGAVAALGVKLGLDASQQVRVARRIWGAKRHIDVVLADPATRKTLGVECKFQAVGGTAEEKIPSTIQDIAAWPIPGIVVFAGEGFTENMRAFLVSTGKAVEFSEVEPWLRLFFGLKLG